MSAVAGLAALLAGFGVLLAAAAAFGALPPPRQRAGSWAPDRELGVRAAAGLGAGLVGWALTGWPVAALAAALAAGGLTHRRRSRPAGPLARLAGLEEWTRRLADAITAGAGLEHALQTTAPTAPAAIFGPVGRLAGRLRAHTPTETALRGFADDLGDETGDLIAGALILAAGRRGPGLAPVLTGLAASVAEDLTARRQIEAERAKPRATARWVTAITVLLAAGLVLLDRPYVAPFATPAGQIALAAICGIFTGGFYWLHRLAAGPAPARFLPPATGRPSRATSPGQFSPDRGRW